MFKNITALQEDIDPNLIPGVISHKMIQNSYLDLFHGEQRRLKELEPIEYEKMTIIRLEFKNILRIDHLWILPNLTKLSLNYNKLERIENIETLVNLKELNLSFNYIEKIQNLDNLMKLETLSLYHNLIKKIENLENLKKLNILSIGNNQIDSYDGLERFRFFKDLKVLNLEGNPIAKNEEKPLREYLTALLPQLQYYNYIYITEKERTQSLEKYRHFVELIETNESDELILNAKKEKEIADEKKLSSSFVELLNEYQLFDSLWIDDENGAALRLIGNEAEELIKTYREDFFKGTQEIYKIGVEKYAERKNEIETFDKYVEQGRIASQKKSISVVENFLKERDEILVEARNVFVKIEKYREKALDDNSDEIIECNTEIDKYFNTFKDKLDIIWETLMSHEINLYEAIEEVLGTFECNVTELLQSFLEIIPSLFISLRDITLNFSKLLSVEVSSYIRYNFALGGNLHIVPTQLHKCIENKDNIQILIDGMKNWHLQKIEDRENRIIIRSKDWIKSLIAKKRHEELERNRYKLTEINYFINQMRDSFTNVQSEVQDEFKNA